MIMPLFDAFIIWDKDHYDVRSSPILTPYSLGIIEEMRSAYDIYSCYQDWQLCLLHQEEIYTRFYLWFPHCDVVEVLTMDPIAYPFPEITPLGHLAFSMTHVPYRPYADIAADLLPTLMLMYP